MPNRDVMGTALRGRRTGTIGGQRRNVNSVSHGSYRKIFDGRTRDAKEIQIVALRWVGDLGGVENLSSMELSIIENLSVIAWRARRLARAIVEGNGNVPESVTKDFLKFHGALVTGLKEIGLKRRAREESLTLESYLKQKQL